MKSKATRKWTERRLTKFLDGIKDAIDELHEIPHGKQEREAARELVEYIQLHHLDGGT